MTHFAILPDCFQHTELSSVEPNTIKKNNNIYSIYTYKIVFLLFKFNIQHISFTGGYFVYTHIN